MRNYVQRLPNISSIKTSVFALSGREQNISIVAKKTSLVLQLSDCFSQAFNNMSNTTDKTWTYKACLYSRKCLRLTSLHFFQPVWKSKPRSIWFLEFELLKDRAIAQLWLLISSQKQLICVSSKIVSANCVWKQLWNLS